MRCRNNIFLYQIKGNVAAIMDLYYTNPLEVQGINHKSDFHMKRIHVFLISFMLSNQIHSNEQRSIPKQKTILLFT